MHKIKFASQLRDITIRFYTYELTRTSASRTAKQSSDSLIMAIIPMTENPSHSPFELDDLVERMTTDHEAR